MKKSVGFLSTALVSVVVLSFSMLSAMAADQTTNQFSYTHYETGTTVTGYAEVDQYTLYGTTRTSPSYNGCSVRGEILFEKNSAIQTYSPGRQSGQGFVATNVRLPSGATFIREGYTYHEGPYMKPRYTMTLS